jgi:MscS family membrane protein
MLSVIRLAEKLGIKFAFPTQTLHVETFPGQESLSPQYNSNLDELKANIQHLLNKK